VAQEKLSGKLEAEKVFVFAGWGRCGQQDGALDTVSSTVGSGAFRPQLARAYPGAASRAQSFLPFTSVRKTFINPLPSCFDGETQNCRWDFRVSRPCSNSLTQMRD